MAGGPNAEHVACMTCMLEDAALVKATRTSSGIETDWYLCEHGHQSGCDWSHGGPPNEPQWPPSAETVAAIVKIQQSRKPK